MPELMCSSEVAQQCLHALRYINRCQKNERMLPILYMDTSVQRICSCCCGALSMQWQWLAALSV